MNVCVHRSRMKPTCRPSCPLCFMHVRIDSTRYACYGRDGAISARLKDYGLWANDPDVRIVFSPLP